FRSGVKARLRFWFQNTVFPQHMRAGECRVAAEIDFDGGRKPAEIVAVALPNEECGFGEIHFPCHVQHPGWFGGFRENADGGGVSCKRLVCKCVDLCYAEAHASKSIAPGSIDLEAWASDRKSTRLNSS